MLILPGVIEADPMGVHRSMGLPAGDAVQHELDVARQDGVVPVMQRASVPMFNDVEKFAEAGGLLHRFPRLRDLAHKKSLLDAAFRDRRRP